MSTPSTSPRYVLFPQVRADDGAEATPMVRRYSLARLHLQPRRPGDGRYDYLKRAHD